MPDLLTHVLSGYFLSRVVKVWDVTLLYVGLILPDMLSRPLYLLIPGLFWYVKPLHSPLVLILVCLLISYLFKREIRSEAFVLLFSGACLHLALDFMQTNTVIYYYWLFPFSFEVYTLGLIWPEDSMIALPFLLAAALIVHIAQKRRSNK